MKKAVFLTLMGLVGSAACQAALITGSTLNISGDAVVGPTFLNWQCNASGGPATCPANSGDFSISSSTGTFAQYNGTFGFEMDISNSSQPLNTPISLPNFITFALNGNETIQLTFLPLGNDTLSPTCAGLSHCTPSGIPGLVTAANPAGTSAFNLDANLTGTAATFGIMGVIHDISGASAPLTGTYTAQFNGDNPQQVLALLAAAGAAGVNSTYSAQMSFTVTPEPMTLSLTGVALIGLGILGRRKSIARK